MVFSITAADSTLMWTCSLRLLFFCLLFSPSKPRHQASATSAVHATVSWFAAALRSALLVHDPTGMSLVITVFGTFDGNVMSVYRRHKKSTFTDGADSAWEREEDGDSQTKH